MRWLASSPILLTFLAVTLVYWSGAVFAFPRYLIEFADGIVIACSATVAMIYGRRAIGALSRDRPDIADMVVVGITGGWLVTAVDRAWRMTARVTANPAMLDYPIVGYMLILLALFACLHLLVKSAMANGQTPDTSERVTMESWGVITTAVFAGCALGLVAIAADRALIGE